MHPRTTVALATAALLLTATACSPSDSDSKATDTPAPAGTTSAPVYDPAAWKTRIATLVTQLGQEQNGCDISPSAEPCATLLRSVDETILDMTSALADSGKAARYPATSDHLGMIIDGYNTYISRYCPGNPAADDQDSECRVAVATVVMGMATLPSDMAQDAGRNSPWHRPATSTVTVRTGVAR
ncbi:hypothetical protein [Streptomyces sp. NPDC049040]|uniref:hypothetical protein n=1 Tax=Streptomyces sp. NPDC049040 TaxID=3365593 RepID=UPI0037159F2C